MSNDESFGRTDATHGTTAGASGRGLDHAERVVRIVMDLKDSTIFRGGKRGSSQKRVSADA